MRGRIAICQVALLLLGAPALSAELFYMDHDPYTDQYVGPVGPLVVSGEIVPGDYDRLLSKILDDPNRFLAENKIILASDGGDVAEALKIATLVKSLFSEVIVGSLTGRCASACFFIYAAANQRETDGERLIGINRPYLVDAEAESPPPPSPSTPAAPSPPIPPASLPQVAPASPTDVVGAENRALRKVRVFLQENAVPGYLVDEMFRRPSDEVYWLSEDDLKNLGYKSPAFKRYLRSECAWGEDLEREVYAGKRSVDDLKEKWKCRARVTQQQARQALLLASKVRESELKPH
jgi:hypothetical protein